MKKILTFLFVFITVSISLWAQGTKGNAAEIENGYFGLKWGCTTQDLKAKYPNVYSTGKNDIGDDVYCLDGDEVTRIFFFAENKMYSARIAYQDLTVEKATAIIEKVIETYGSPSRTSKGSADGNEYAVLYIYYSNNITIEIRLTEYYNAYGRAKGNTTMVTYTNNKMKNDVTKKRQEKMKDDLEL